jgi:hypothetical protein
MAVDASSRQGDEKRARSGLAGVDHDRFDERLGLAVKDSAGYRGDFNRRE